MTEGDSIECIYKGNWFNDLRSGEGKTIWKISTQFISYGGKYKSDLPNGKGLMIYSNKDQYAGFWLNGKRHGYGEFSFPDGRIIYEGMWENDLYHG